MDGEAQTVTWSLDPTADDYTDEAAVRADLADAFAVCNDCRRCVDRCASFPTLFDLLDTMSSGESIAAPGDMTPAQQDQVVDGCVQCAMCTAACPYGTHPGGDGLDVAGLMLRANAMRRTHRHTDASTRRAGRTMGRTGAVGRLAVRVPVAANRLVGAPAGSLRRRLAARLFGVSATRRVAPFANERFSVWFQRRPRINFGRSQRSVTFVPTCLVEFQDTAVGKDVVKVYERNGVECEVSNLRCCGAPLLHAGDVKGFAAVAEKNVRTLAEEIKSGTDVVVGQPSCLTMLRQEYPRHVSAALRDEAAFVAAHSSDPSEYLMALHRTDDAVLDTEFHGSIPRSLAVHSSSHLRALGVGFAGRDVIRLTGARVEVIQQSAGVEGIWGLRAANDGVADAMGERFAERVERATGDLVAGDCLLSADVVTDRTDRATMHPIEVLARAYGIPVER